MLLPDQELEQMLNDMLEDGYDVFKMYRNEPVAGVGRTTVVFKLRRYPDAEEEDPDKKWNPVTKSNYDWMND